MTIDIVPFQQEFLSQAAELLAGRHRNDRLSLPELPARFESPAEAEAAIAAALGRSHARGYAALDGGRLVAYLIGDMVIDNLWGRAAWVRMAGCAYDPDSSVEVVRDLYATLGAHWVEAGVFIHFALVPVADPALIQAWFSLCFGIEQVHALVDLEWLQPAMPEVPAYLTIRKATQADRQALANMSDVIWRHQVTAPVWGIQMPETIGEMRDGWAGTVDEDDAAVWLAFADGQVVGVQGYWPASPAADNLLTPEQCIELSIAGTRASVRGKGIGTLLTRTGLAQARASGYRFCETDWRSTNLLASRFWPKQGFRPVAYRLVRRIDARIAWANGNISRESHL
jgi:GNAT superfamily N-acetyltransferase